MALDVSNLQAYIDEQAIPMVSVMQAKPVTASLADIQTGIKGSAQLIEFGGDIQFNENDDCNRVTTGNTTTFGRKVITVGDISMNEDLCPKELNGFYLQTLLKKGADGDKVLPAEIAGIYMEDKLAKAARQLEVSDWQGEVGGAGGANLVHYDGIQHLVADAVTAAVSGYTPINVAGTEDEMTQATAIADLNAMYQAAPVDMLEAEDLTIFLGLDALRLYKAALTAANLFHHKVEGLGTDAIYLHGTNVKVVGTVGLNGTKDMYLMETSNIVIGMDGENDIEFEARLDPVTNQTIFMDCEFKRGIQLRHTGRIVTHIVA